jgi:four helix bundle protein
MVNGDIMNAQQFQDRTKALALRVIKLVEAMPKSKTGDVIGRQVLRSATSVAANYRAACNAQSRADMLKKLKIVEEEADETLLWLELIIESQLLPESKVADLKDETRQIVKMVVASIKTLKARK